LWPLSNGGGLAEVDRALGRPLSYPCWIELGAGGDPIPCRIGDVSQGGAKLIVANAASVPTQIRLRFSLTGETCRPCIVWERFPDGVGVRFIHEK